LRNKILTVLLICGLFIFPVRGLEYRVFRDWKENYDYDIRAVEAVQLMSKEKIDFMTCTRLVGNIPICATEDSINVYTVVFGFDFNAIVIVNHKD